MKMRKYLLIVLVMMLVFGVGLTVQADIRAPYPPSSVIIGIMWDPVSSVVYKAEGSDTFPITWADDGNLYTAFGDGWGFSPKTPEKLSLGFACITGDATNFIGVNIRSSSGEQYGDGKSGLKASGMLSVNGTIYMAVRNANKKGEQTQLAWSSDHAKTWTWSDWRFEELGYVCFLNFGRDYLGVPDHLKDYVYLYSPDTPSAYNETNRVVLARVPKDQINNRSAYEFFKGLDSNNEPRWVSDISKRGSVFNFLGGCNRMSVTYNAPLKRYLMTQRSRGKVGGVDQFSIYDAPEPWGPWTTVYYTESWEDNPISKEGWGECAHIPSKWISDNGKMFYLVFSGKDSFAVRKASLIIAE